MTDLEFWHCSEKYLVMSAPGPTLKVGTITKLLAKCYQSRYEDFYGGLVDDNLIQSKKQRAKARPFGHCSID